MVEGGLYSEDLMKNFRIYHLLAAGAAAVAYLTAEELGLVHAWVGYLVAALIAVRLLLGLARRNGFSFIRLVPRSGPAPKAALGRALNLALFVAILGVAGTGIAMDQGGTLVGQSIRHNGEDEGEHGERDEEREAALAPLPGSATGFGLIGVAQADEEGRAGEGEREDEHGLLGEIHETLGNALLPLAAAHVLFLLLFRRDLMRFMLFVPRRRA